MKCNKALTQHSFRYSGCKIWNDLADKFKKTFYLSVTSFRNHIKIFLSKLILKANYLTATEICYRK